MAFTFASFYNFLFMSKSVFVTYMEAYEKAPSNSYCGYLIPNNVLGPFEMAQFFKDSCDILRVCSIWHFCCICVCLL